jgi:predicted DNA-binding transcriptional regulator AlpA
MNEQKKIVALRSEPSPGKMVVQMTVEELRSLICSEIAAANDEADRGGEEGLATMEEAVEFLAVGKHWLYKNSGKLPFAVKVGGALRFDKKGMRRWLESRKR